MRVEPNRPRRTHSTCAGIVFLVLLGVGCTQVTKTREVEHISSPPQAVIPADPTPSPAFRARSGFVNDFASVLDENTKRELEDKLARFQSERRVDFAIVTVDSTGEKPIDDYSLEMAKEWKVGAENGGLLLVVSIVDRHWRIQIDRKLEHVMSNDEVRQIGELMIPEFKEKQYSAGIRKCVDAMITTITKKVNRETRMLGDEATENSSFHTPS